MKRHYLLLLTLLPFAFILSCEQPAEPVVGLLTDSAMVVTAHPLATEAGVAILQQGGNAYDAAVAVHLALAVVLPRAGNLGGGGFLVYRTGTGEKGALDFRERAPAAANKNMYLDSAGNVIDGLSIKGHLAAGVPGSVAGMAAMHQKLGVLPWADVVAPSIKLAEDGYVLTNYAAGLLNRFQESFKEVNGADFWLLKEEWKEGERMVQPELAATLKRIAAEGAAGFYEGETAELIAAEMQRGGGLITTADLANYTASWREPLQASYRGHNIVSMPPSSSGGVAVVQLLKGSEAYPMSEFGHNSSRSIHVMTELMRRTYADRATYLGDADYFPVPVQRLTSNEYLKERMADISLTVATSSQEIKQGEVERIESFETTHYSITDSYGNAAAVTTTLNSFFGNKVYVKGAGFFLNNEMDDFSAKPGIPNQFGLVGSAANAIAPGKRMLSSMTPTIVEKNDSLFMVLGTPGGSTIITNVYQVIVNAIDHQMNMQQAVDAKKIHAQWLPDIITIEEGAATEAVADSLQALGHELKFTSQMGRFQAIMRRSGGGYEGAADRTRTGDSFADGF